MGDEQGALAHWAEPDKRTLSHYTNSNPNPDPDGEFAGRRLQFPALCHEPLSHPRTPGQTDPNANPNLNLLPYKLHHVVRLELVLG